MFQTIVIAIVAVIAGILIFASTKPDAFSVKRAISINASPEKIFPLINDFHHWATWSPWEKLDLTMKKSHSGAESGTGAVYEWDGNKKVGTGRMEITDSSAQSKVVIKLDFLKPFEAHNTAEFTLEGKGNSTEVTWVMYGASPFMSKVMSVFCDMDKLIGKDFEAGLATMKTLAEK